MKRLLYLKGFLYTVRGVKLPYKDKEDYNRYKKEYFQFQKKKVHGYDTLRAIFRDLVNGIISREEAVQRFLAYEKQEADDKLKPKFKGHYAPLPGVPVVKREVEVEPSVTQPHTVLPMTVTQKLEKEKVKVVLKNEP